MQSRVRGFLGIAVGLAVFFLLTGGSTAVFADSTTITIGVGNDTSMSGGAPPTGITSVANGNGYYGPYATVDLLLGNNSNGVAAGAIRVTVNMTAGYAIFGNNAFAFNLTGSLTPSDLNISFGTAGYSVGSPGQISAFGKFEYVISDGNSPGHTGAGALVFTLTKKSGSFASVNDIIDLSTGGAAGGYGTFAMKVGKLNSNGTAFVSDITNADGSITSGTGYARNGNSSPVPEPTSLLMLGSGLLVVGRYTWKARRRN